MREKIFSRTILLLMIVAWLLSLQFSQAQQPVIGDSLQVMKDIVYKKSSDNIALGLDIYRRNGNRLEKRPVIIFVHGGGFWEGDKASPIYVKMAGIFALHGYVAVSVNYQLKNKDKPYSHSVLDSCKSDVLSVLQWLTKHTGEFGIDTLRFLICGDSAGGGIAVNTAFDSSNSDRFKGCIDLWGGLPGDSSWEAPIFEGKLPRNTPATCIIHGMADRIVPFSTSTMLANRLALAGVYHELHILKEADHYPVQLSGVFIPWMLQFADKVFQVRQP